MGNQSPLQASAGPARASEPSYGRILLVTVTMVASGFPSS